MSDKADSKENQSPNKSKKTLVSTLANQIDNDFERLLVFIKERDLNQITEAVKQNLRHFAATNYQTYKGSIDYFNKYKLWGSYYPENEDYELAENRADALVNHREDFEWIYKKLKDNRSKRIMVNILYYWLMSDTKRIEQISDRTFEQYFDLDIVKCSKKEVFVDIGGYIGDTIVSYSRVYGKDCYKKIYSYEIVPSGMEYIEKNIKLFGLDNVEVRQKGASSKNGSMYLASDDLSSVSQLSENGILEVPTVKIDDDIEGEVTFIKMDIEGGEEDALLGCLEKIRQYHPKLALSIYHNHKDIWKLARIIDEVDSSYKFYIRYYGSATLPAEYVLYAI